MLKWIKYNTNYSIHQSLLRRKTIFVKIRVKVETFGLGAQSYERILEELIWLGTDYYINTVDLSKTYHKAWKIGFWEGIIFLAFWNLRYKRFDLVLVIQNLFGVALL